MVQSAQQREMTEESSATSHLSVAMSTKEDDKTQTTGGPSKSTSVSSNEEFYFQSAVVVIGVVGVAGNALILYALVVSKQHKKHVLIVNQNVLDLFSCFFLAITYALKLSNLYLSGTLGYWLCIILLSENLVWWGTNGSIVNLAIITIDRYLKVVHPVWSRNYLRPWVIKLAMASAWFVGSVYNTIMVFVSSVVIDGVCYSYIIWEGQRERIILYGIWYIMSFYVIILVIFIFCYGRILAAIRRQARVMAQTGSTTTQAQSHQIQSNVIKTMIVVSGFYAITWLPGNVYGLLGVLGDNTTLIDSRYYAAMFIAFCSVSINPFIYATKFHLIKKVLIDTIACMRTPV